MKKIRWCDTQNLSICDLGLLYICCLGLMSICYLGLRVRHTPPVGHPSPRGDGYAVHYYAYCCIKQLDIQTVTAPSPLGEGCPKGGVCRTRNPKRQIDINPK
ncbi:MAG: hypothetical protein IKR79_05370 [Bacteroidales bacterium]|nr:hypothetical protein [Bacteroidales bacterium]